MKTFSNSSPRPAQPESPSAIANPQLQTKPSLNPKMMAKARMERHAREMLRQIEVAITRLDKKIARLSSPGELKQQEQDRITLRLRATHILSALESCSHEELHHLMQHDMDHHSHGEEEHHDCLALGTALHDIAIHVHTAAHREGSDPSHARMDNSPCFSTGNVSMAGFTHAVGHFLHFPMAQDAIAY